MKKAIVKFYVGVKHPLYDKEVEAEILVENTGYDGRRTYAKTIEEVYYPEVKEGILIYTYGELVGYEDAPARSEIYEGYVKVIRFL